MSEEIQNHYHFICYIRFPSPFPQSMGRKLESLGFVGFQPKRRNSPYTFSKSSDDYFDLLIEENCEGFLRLVKEDLLGELEEIEAYKGEISICMGLHEYSDLISVALHFSRASIEMLNSLHADLDIDRYFYLEDEEEEE